MPSWNECGWVGVVTTYHGGIHFTGTHLICAYQQSGAGSLDVVDSFACDPNKTYSQLAYHLPPELVNERDHRCVKDEL